MSKTINWGIIGLGKIAHKFAADVLLVENANLYAVASRSQDKADDFGAKYGAEKCYPTYEALVNDPNVDAVYIATPMTFHCENTLMSLEAGKHVLCEKAFGMNKAEVEKMIAKAQEKQLFLMEALWSRFIPGILKVMELLENNAIGDIKTIKADFGFKAPYNVEGRLFNADLGGGALLDIGIYPIFLSLLTLGKPTSMQTSAIMSATKVDESNTMIFHYENDQTAILDSTLVASTPTEAWIHGTKGSIKIPRKFHHPEQVIHYDLDFNVIADYKLPYQGFGYCHEIEEVNNCLREGKIESDKMTFSFSLDLIELLDKVQSSFVIA